MQKEYDLMKRLLEQNNGRVPIATVRQAIEADRELSMNNYVRAKQALRANGEAHVQQGRNSEGVKFWDLVAGKNPAKNGGE